MARCGRLSSGAHGLWAPRGVSDKAAPRKRPSEHVLDERVGDQFDHVRIRTAKHQGIEGCESRQRYSCSAYHGRTHIDFASVLLQGGLHAGEGR